MLVVSRYTTCGTGTVNSHFAAMQPHFGHCDGVTFDAAGITLL